MVESNPAKKQRRPLRRLRDRMQFLSHSQGRWGNDHREMVAIDFPHGMAFDDKQDACPRRLRLSSSTSTSPIPIPIPIPIHQECTHLYASLLYGVVLVSSFYAPSYHVAMLCCAVSLLLRARPYLLALTDYHSSHTVHSKLRQWGALHVWYLNSTSIVHKYHFICRNDIGH